MCTYTMYANRASGISIGKIVSQLVHGFRQFRVVYIHVLNLFFFVFVFFLFFGRYESVPEMCDRAQLNRTSENSAKRECQLKLKSNRHFHTVSMLALETEYLHHFSRTGTHSHHFRTPVYTQTHTHSQHGRAVMKRIQSYGSLEMPRHIIH